MTQLQHAKKKRDECIHHYRDCVGNRVVYQECQNLTLYRIGDRIIS